MKIAISGKGGVGKTTIAAALINSFAERGFNVYAVDADPDASLGTALGLSADALTNLRPVMDMQEVIAERAGGSGMLYTLNPKVDDLMDTFSIRLGRISFLRMGTVKQGGSSCYCRENSFLHAVLSNLLLDRKDVVVMDMGAGIEHLTRGTSRGVDLMIVVSEPTVTSIQTAEAVRKLSADLGISSIKVLANKVRSNKERDFITSRIPAGELLGILPFTEEILDSAMVEPSGLLGATGGVLPGLDDIAAQIVAEIAQ